MTPLHIDIHELIQQTPDPMFCLDMDFNVLSYNRHATSLDQLMLQSEILEGDFGQIDLKAGKYTPNPYKTCVINRVAEEKKQARTQLLLCTDKGVMTTWDLRVIPLQCNGQSILFADFLDLTAFTRVERALRESEQRYILAAKAANDSMWEYDLTTDRMYYSERWKTMLGLDAKLNIGKSIDFWLDRVHPADIGRLQSDLSMEMSGTAEVFENEHRIKTESGEYQWMLCRGATMKNANGAVIKIAGSLTDIHHRKQMELRLKYDAYHDSLTGLPNRSYFNEHLHTYFEKLTHSDSLPFAVLFFDFDRFKLINDSYGHQVGDMFLIEVARRMQACMDRVNESVDIEQEMIVSRLGGDEFTVLLSNIREVEQAVVLADELQVVLGKPYVFDDLTLYTSASIGIVMGDPRYNSAQDILRDADTAMYRAKYRGRGCHVVFDPHMHKQVADSLQLENELFTAIRNEELCLYYQPVIDLDTAEMVGLEGLSRWRHPTRGLVHPERFISIAEESGSIVHLGRWVIEEACKQITIWRDQLGGEFNAWISVNVSRRQFLDEGLIDFLKQTLEKYGIPEGTLCLEITESIVAEDIDNTVTLLNELRELNIPLVMDDFGAGQSSMSRLHMFPVQLLKIDKEFIHAMTDNRKLAAVVHAIISLAHNFNLEVVAEGIESPTQLAEVIAMGARYAQGYHFGKPVSAEEVLDMLRNTSFA